MFKGSRKMDREQASLKNRTGMGQDRRINIFAARGEAHEASFDLQFIGSKLKVTE